MFPPELLLLKFDELQPRVAERAGKVAAYKALDDIMGQSVSEEQWNGCVLQKDQAHSSLRPNYQQLPGLAKGTPKFHTRSE